MVTFRRTVLKQLKWSRVLFCLCMMVTVFGLTALADEPACTTISLNTTYTIAGKQGQTLYYRYPIDESRYGTYTLWIENARESNANASMNGYPQYNRRQNYSGSIDLCITPASDTAAFRLVKIKPAAGITIKSVPTATAQSILGGWANANCDGIVFEVTYTDGSKKEYVYKETYRGQDPHVQGRYMHWTDDGGVYMPEFDAGTSILRIRHFCYGDTSGLLSDAFKVTAAPGNAVTSLETQPVQNTEETKPTVANPAGTSVRKLVSGRKRFTVRWKKSKEDITGYQIRYSLKRNMKKAKRLTVSKRAASKTVKKLKAGKKYYVQIRTYKKADGKTYYSAWSKRKSIRTK